jgi:hypothetical protein
LKAVANQFSFGSWNIAGLKLTLSGPAISTKSFNAMLSTVDTGSISLATGEGYRLAVSGFANGATGGIYSLMMGTAPLAFLGLTNIAPVPEPAEWLLMMAGFAIVFSMVARRRR